MLPQSIALSDPSPWWRSQTLLVIAFIVIAVVFIAADYTVVYRLDHIEGTTHTIIENMLAGVELVSRMGRDVTRERRLIEAHILTSNTGEMTELERQIGDVQTDFVNAVTAYEALKEMPGDQATWQRLKGRAETIKAQLSDLLLISRRDEDLQARQVLELIEPQFEEVGADVDTLIEINREGAERQVQTVAIFQRSLTELQTILSLTGLAVTAFVGWWTVQLIGKRENQLLEKSAMLEDRNRDLDAFAGRVAHDLRNPLSTAHLATYRLAKEVPSAEETVAVLRRAVDHMNVLIEELLLLSRAGAPIEGMCDPAKAAAEVVEDLMPRIQREGGTVSLNVVPVKVRGSQGLLHQVLVNLIDNALKYRRQNVPVHIEVEGRLQEYTYRLGVSDNGVGMSPDDCAKVFEPFYRAPRSRKINGTGLGLSIVKRVIEASGGTVSVHSELDRGTTFVIELPVAQDDKAVA